MQRAQPAAPDSGRSLPDGGVGHEPQEHELRGERGGAHRAVRRARDGAGHTFCGE